MPFSNDGADAEAHSEKRWPTFCRVNRCRPPNFLWPFNSRTVRRELHGMDFHGRAAASKPYISKCNVKCWMQWRKARHHWTLEQWRHVLWSNKLRFSIRQSDGRVWVWRLPPLEWIITPTESQAFPSNISVWPHKCASGRMVKNSHKHTPKPCGKPSQKSWSCYSCKGWTDIILNPMD